jgi:CHAD domain-containing protein
MSSSRPRHKLLRSRLDRFARLLHGVEQGDVRAIHRTRVASRRLRELLPVLQLDGNTAERLADRLRIVTRRLGEVRELDVLLAVVGELHAADGASRRVLGQIGGEIRRSRDRAREKRVGKRLVSELHRISRKLSSAADSLEKREDDARQTRAWRWAAEARVARRAELLRDAIAEAGALYIPERLHTVRIALKKFRYAVEVEQEVSRQERPAELRTLKRGQDLLGRMHDLQVLIDTARATQASVNTPNVATWREYDALVNRLERECRQLHARYMRERDAIAAVAEKRAAKAHREKHADGRRAV